MRRANHRVCLPPFAALFPLTLSEPHRLYRSIPIDSSHRGFFLLTYVVLSVALLLQKLRGVVSEGSSPGSATGARLRLVAKVLIVQKPYVNRRRPVSNTQFVCRAMRPLSDPSLRPRARLCYIPPIHHFVCPLARPRQLSLPKAQHVCRRLVQRPSGRQGEEPHHLLYLAILTDLVPGPSVPWQWAGLVFDVQSARMNKSPGKASGDTA